MQRWPWERIGRGKLLLCCVCSAAREALGRPRVEERGGGISCPTRTACYCYYTRCHNRTRTICASLSDTRISNVNNKTLPTKTKTTTKTLPEKMHDNSYKILLGKQAVRVAIRYAPAPLPPWVPQQTQRSSSFPRRIRSHGHRCTCLTR